MSRSAEFVIYLIVLVGSELTADRVEPQYSQEILEKVDGAKLLDSLFAENGENVKNYMDLSLISKEAETENPQSFDDLTKAADYLPSDFLSTVVLFQRCFLQSF